MPLLYQDLRRLASARLRNERDGHTLGTTALAHEAFMRLSAQRHLRPQDRQAFFAAASNTMRRILVDYARSRRRQKRGDGAVVMPLDDIDPMLPEPAIDETLALELTRNVDDVNVHEMAHAWFGDAIVCRDFAHAWLKESWATYIAQVWFDDVAGADEGRYQLWRDA